MISRPDQLMNIDSIDSRKLRAAARFLFELLFLSIVAFSFLGCERIIGRHELDVSCQCFVSSFCEKPETRMKLERTGDAEAVGIVTKYSLIHLFVRLSSYRFSAFIFQNQHF